MNRLGEVRTAAVDLGASSGRVMAGLSTADGVTLREVHRFANQPIEVDGVLRWDIRALYAGVLDGLKRAERALGGLDSVGVDGWAVDYGLLDRDGELLVDPAHYRDARTEPYVHAVLDTVGADALYAATGIQLQPFNTMFQLLADQEMLAGAHTALLVPDLIAYWLSGVPATELTNASTTGLLDPNTLGWSTDLAARLGAPVGLFPPLRRPGTILGPIRNDVAASAGLVSRPLVVTVASHDTAAAVAGVPAESGRFAYVCTGTWALVGLELSHPVVTDAARAANFTNEVGADDTVRFLRNVTGFWLLQQSVAAWRGAGLSVDLDELTRAAAALPGGAVVDVQEPAFTAPVADMPALIRAACFRSSGVSLDGPAAITRCILDSIALAVRHALRDAARCSGVQPEVIHVVGGGVANSLFCQLVADAGQLPVLAGPTEAAAWGNTLMQVQTLGLLPPGLPAARATIRAIDPPVSYSPRTGEELWQRLDELIR